MRHAWLIMSSLFVEFLYVYIYIYLYIKALKSYLTAQFYQDVGVARTEPLGRLGRWPVPATPWSECASTWDLWSLARGLLRDEGLEGFGFMNISSYPEGASTQICRGIRSQRLYL